MHEIQPIGARSTQLFCACSANEAAPWAREVNPSLVRIRSTCPWAVLGEITRVFAIALWVKPWAMRSATCRSRVVKWGNGQLASGRGLRLFAESVRDGFGESEGGAFALGGQERPGTEGTAHHPYACLVVG